VSAVSDLAGQVAIVTGSSSGIGKACAEHLAAAGASVVVNSSSSVEAGEKVAAGLTDAIYVQAGIADEGGAERLVEAAIERWGRIDILVNNAGTTQRIAFTDLDAVTDDVWHSILGTNVIGTWKVSRAAAKAMAATGGGVIVNVTSAAGVRPVGSSLPYAVSKAALNHMTQCLAVALGPAIRVNAVAPGLVETPWTDGWDAGKQMASQRAPLRRIADPDDVAATIMGLIRSPMTTGAVLMADGGLGLV
jgi:ketoreductase RED2